MELGRLRYDRIALLTGTPIQNNIEELWTLLNIINPQQFDSFLDFSDEFGDLKESSKVEKLQKLLRPFLLCRRFFFFFFFFFFFGVCYISF
jgi:chromodomain-helicase-DNA-binding protein 7